MLTRFRSQVAMLGAAAVLGLAGCAGTGEKVGTAVDDTAVTTKVKTALAADREVSATRVHVNTDKGVVRLTGTVKSWEERRRAEQVARNVNGVTSVNNELAVNATTD